MKIAGWAFMLVGIIVSGYVKFIEVKRPEVNLTIFFWLGILFVVFGFFRELFRRLQKKQEEKELAGPPEKKEEHQTLKHPAGHEHGRSHHSTHHHKESNHQSYPYQPKHKGCPRCHSPNHNNASFCHRCGTKF